MSDTLPAIQTTRKSGAERFHAGSTDLGFDILSFWQWSVSDLIGNTARGVLAEYLVARALGLSTAGTRDEWAPYDLLTPSEVKIQVKSAAYLQSWHQVRLSRIVFKTKATRSWDPLRGKVSPKPTREADVYVFALLAHRDKNTLDPMNVEQWRFYVTPRSLLDEYPRSQDSIALRSLEGLKGVRAVSFSELAQEFERCAEELKRRVASGDAGH
jgi:hypothetical protein